jgi:hypothetical protein
MVGVVTHRVAPGVHTGVTHVPLQAFWPPVQTHLPPWHDEPTSVDEHDVPHAPQLAESVDVLVHVLLQSVSPPGHWHAPPLATLAHTAPPTVQPAHEAPPLPHEDADSLAKSSHAVPLLQQPLQPLVALQTQLLPEHVVPVRQTWPQAPQLFESDVVSVHVPLHNTWPAEHPLTQA